MCSQGDAQFARADDEAAAEYPLSQRQSIEIPVNSSVKTKKQNTHSDDGELVARLRPGRDLHVDRQTCPTHANTRTSATRSKPPPAHTDTHSPRSGRWRRPPRAPRPPRACPRASARACPRGSAGSAGRTASRPASRRSSRCSPRRGRGGVVGGRRLCGAGAVPGRKTREHEHEYERVRGWRQERERWWTVHVSLQKWQSKDHPG